MNTILIMLHSILIAIGAFTHPVALLFILLFCWVDYRCIKAIQKEKLNRISRTRWEQGENSNV